MAEEPDPSRLRRAYDLLETQPKEALPELEALAAGGSVWAHIYLGTMFARGMGVEIDDARAESHFSKACASGLNEGCYQLGLFYYARGEHRKAQSAFHKAAVQGCSPAAEPDLPRLQRAYDLRKTQPKKALAELEALVARGSIGAHVCLGEMFAQGMSVQIDEARAESHFLEACASGVNEGCYQLGLFYYRNRKHQKAHSAFLKAAAQGFLPATYWLGRVIENIPDYPDRERVAISLFEQAAERGHVQAQIRMSRMLLRGGPGKRNILKWVRFFPKFVANTFSVAFADEFDPRGRGREGPPFGHKSRKTRKS
jgi:TPR repeat protein